MLYSGPPKGGKKKTKEIAEDAVGTVNRNANDTVKASTVIVSS